MKLTRPIDTADGTLGCVCLSRRADDEEDHSLKRGTGNSEQGGLSVEKSFGMERLHTLQGCLNEMRANHAIVAFLENIP